MFTGIITDIGTVRSAEQRGDLRLTIGCGYDMDSVDLGASIACSGACLTVVDKGDDWFAVDLSAETVSKTAKGLWDEGAKLNLERALKVGDELGGHIVTGHVDGVGEVTKVVEDGDSMRVTIAAPAALSPYFAAKGSITLDGVSLTVNEVEGANFSVNIIPHTADHTTFAGMTAGRQLNIEIDILARYLKRMMDSRM
ncbi:riboflavin synthase [Sphingomicrobium clamense]|uniref:Riboflavin synthase n=1 Tax=Sphingomicrobium clamense TaxID=2851013 RepID=A0ABS6V2V4_9SPHN|nr:riboflavin synthase [Sphingomicrobium sp. B8]